MFILPNRRKSNLTLLQLIKIHSLKINFYVQSPLFIDEIIIRIILENRFNHQIKFSLITEFVKKKLQRSIRSYVVCKRQKY